jgi:PAS domain S-box-containing protein
MQELFPNPAASVQLESVRKVIRNDRGSVNEAQSFVRGVPRWYRTSIQPIHDEHGGVAYALVNSTDIHDLKIAQQDLLELNRTLEERVRERTLEVEDLYENAPAGYHSLDADGNFVRINQTELDWLGYTREEMIGRRFVDFITPADGKKFQANFPILKQRGWVSDLEFGMGRKDGSTFPILVGATAIYDADHTYLMSRSTVLDNTERKKFEDALRESEEQNRMLFEESPDAIALIDASGRIIQANRAYAQLSKFPLDEIVGNTADKLGLVTNEAIDSLGVALVQSVGQQETFATAEHTLCCADGSVVTVESRIFLLRIRGTVHILVTSRDISMRKKAEEALRLANAEMERAMRLKDEFLANMSHELRTPLNGVLAFSESLQEQIYGPLNERQLKSVHNIEVSGQHLLSLINDLLDLSKIEAGKLELNLETVMVDQICRASLMFVKEIAYKKRIQLSYHNDQPRAKFHADARRLKQMLVNLLNNAVKFTPEGGQVQLSVAVHTSEQQIQFAVQDTGPGIAAEHLTKLFQPFMQLDSGLARQFEGTGLGLALVKRLTMQHGGSVHVESAGIPGQGSCFTIVLPYLNTEAEALTSGASGAVQDDTLSLSPQVAGVSVLLAEDNEMNIDAVSGYLAYLGYHLSIARTGPEALERAQAQPPALILMDVQLPLLDGLEVIRRLRRDPRFATTPIIATTALVMPGDRERCFQAGASQFIGKPMRMTELAALMKRLLEP